MHRRAVVKRLSPSQMSQVILDKTRRICAYCNDSLGEMNRLSITLVFFSVSLIGSESNDICNLSAVCGGSSKSSLQSKIAGGESASLDTWGWMVVILLNWTKYCSGTLISSSWVVTSAACLEGYSVSGLVLSAGTTDLFSRCIFHPSELRSSKWSE